MAQMWHLIKPDKIKNKVNETIEKILFPVLVCLVPFVEKETLDKMAEKLADVDLKKLCVIDSFMRDEIFRS